MRTALPAFLLSLAIVATHAVADEPATVANGIYIAASGDQDSADEYTRYDLLAPGSGRFRIRYEVTAITPGAQYFYNPIRKGSAASDESVLDAATGKALPFEVVSGAVARKDALMPDADPDTDYIRVTLPRPVPASGQARLVILKTYEDSKSYFLDGKTLVFDRPLGVKRNKVVLPAGYQVTSLSVPSQIRTEDDGRIAISFMHAGVGTAPLVLRAMQGAQTGKAALPRPATGLRSWESPFEGDTEEERLAERAHQDRSIVYFLQPPETHAFALFHDYTETRPGVNGYANVVRKGSVVSNPSAVDLDSGERLAVKEMSGAEMTEAKIDAGAPVDPAAKVVVISFEPVQAGRTRRLRITETYTAPTSYRLYGDDLVFDRSLGRPRNAIVLPSGWYVTFSGAPATASQLPDGRVRLDYWNDRPQALDVLLKARRRAGGT